MVDPLAFLMEKSKVLEGGSPPLETIGRLIPLLLMLGVEVTLVGNVLHHEVVNLLEDILHGVHREQTYLLVLLQILYYLHHLLR